MKQNNNQQTTPQPSKADLGKSFEKLKQSVLTPVYGLKRLELTGQLTLTKNDQPLMIIPEYLMDDFIHIIARSNVADEMYPQKTNINEADDLKELFNKTETT